MKKIRMIITSVIVLAIVGSAFAFKAKVGSFCVVTNNGSNPTNCTTFIRDRQRVANGLVSYKYYPCWEFDVTACTAANNGKCTAGPITLGAN